MTHPAMADRYSPLPGEGLPSPDSSTSPPFPSEYAPARRSPLDRARRWWAANVKLRLLQPADEPPPSGYLTLIPLSDSRLQPRSTRFTALFLLAFALAVAGSVFMLVPRSVSVGELSVHADRMSWNMTKSTYQLRLLVRVPVYNPNFLKASIEGNLHVLFYGTEAGSARLERVSLPARAAPKLVDVKVDASDVPADYILSILTQCSTFPERLIFFLKGKLQARFLLQRQHLSTIDTYFMIDCKNGGTVPSGPPALEALEDWGAGAPGQLVEGAPGVLPMLPAAAQLAAGGAATPPELPGGQGAAGEAGEGGGAAGAGPRRRGAP